MRLKESGDYCSKIKMMQIKWDKPKRKIIQI